MNVNNINNLVQKCDELRKKMVLLEGDRKAFYENSEWIQNNNKKNIANLRQKYKNIYQKKAEKIKADAELISKSLVDAPIEKKSLRNKPGPVALDLINNKSKDYVNQLNHLRFLSKKYENHITALNTKHDEMVQDASDAAATNLGESESAKEMRNYENMLEKSKLKCREATHIKHTYLNIKQNMLQEYQTFEPRIEVMENEIKKSQLELENQKKINNQAITARDNSKNMLEKQEKEIYASRKRREVELQNVRKQAEEKRIQYDRRTAAASVNGEDQSVEDKNDKHEEQDQNKITNYVEACKKIKDATGVTDTQEVVIRFENQGQTKQRLENMKIENEKTITRLEEEQEKIYEKFQQMKYTGENKLSAGQQMLEDKLDQLKKLCEETFDKIMSKLDNSNTLLLSVKAGIDHLVEKLKPLKTASNDVQKVKVAPESDEYILDQLSICEEKMIKLLQDMDGETIDSIWKLMTENEYINIIEAKQPQHNIHIKAVDAQKETVFDEEDSGDDQEVLTRVMIKKQAQNILDTKNKRKIGNRKKTKDK